MPDPHTVRAYTTRNTLHALEVLAAGPCSAPELAARLSIGDRAARKLLQRCALEGFATQGDWHHRRYAATLRLAALARQLLEGSTLLRFAGPEVQHLAAGSPGAEASLWVPGVDGERALCVLRSAGGAEPEILLGAPVPLGSCAAGRVLAAGADAAPGDGAAPVRDERGTLVAAIALTPARPEDAAAVALAGATITALIRDGVW